MESLNFLTKSQPMGAYALQGVLEHLKHKMIQLLKENIWPLEYIPLDISDIYL